MPKSDHILILCTVEYRTIFRTHISADCLCSEMLMSPLALTGQLGSVDIEATVTLAQSEVVRTTDGTPLLDAQSGFSARAAALRLAIARAVAAFVPAEMREKLRIGTLLSSIVLGVLVDVKKAHTHLGREYCAFASYLYSYVLVHVL